MCVLLTFINHRRWALIVIFSSCLIGISPAYSFEPIDGFQVHGFASQGYFLTNENNTYGESSKRHGSLGLTETGINFSFTPISEAVPLIRTVKAVS